MMTVHIRVTLKQANKPQPDGANTEVSNTWTAECQSELNLQKNGQPERNFHGRPE
jgi:hypothetical protein